jgi:hypothetical protein
MKMPPFALSALALAAGLSAAAQGQTVAGPAPFRQIQEFKSEALTQVLSREVNGQSLEAALKAAVFSPAVGSCTRLPSGEEFAYKIQVIADNAPAAEKGIQEVAANILEEPIGLVAHKRVGADEGELEQMFSNLSPRAENGGASVAGAQKDLIRAIAEGAAASGGRVSLRKGVAAYERSLLSYVAVVDDSNYEVFIVANGECR